MSRSMIFGAFVGVLLSLLGHSALTVTGFMALVSLVLMHYWASERAE